MYLYMYMYVFNVNNEIYRHLIHILYYFFVIYYYMFLILTKHVCSCLVGFIFHYIYTTKPIVQHCEQIRVYQTCRICLCIECLIMECCNQKLLIVLYTRY